MKHIILFFHGFDSSPATDKFQVISRPNKHSIHIDYRTMRYAEVDRAYHNLVQSSIDNGLTPILVGHSLGGYWAVKMAERFGLIVGLANPQLFPTNPNIRDVELYALPTTNNATKFVYLETGDDVIDLAKTGKWAETNVERTHICAGGHHRVADLGAINTLIEQAIAYWK